VPPLRDLAELSRAQGAQAALAYLCDTYDDPHRNFSLKLLLAGPTEAGKSSLLRALHGRPKLMDPDERTIGLDIEELVLADPRAPSGVRFLAYDAGGHDEYQEMHQSFLTGDTLYALLWDISRSVQDNLIRWVTLISTCAPGSTVLLIGSLSAPLHAVRRSVCG